MAYRGPPCRGPGLRSRVFILAAAAALALHLPALAVKSASQDGMTEKQYLARIAAQAQCHDYKAANKTATAFFKAYPRSQRTPEVWIILGDMEASPDRAIEHFRAVLDNYPSHGRADYARYRICETHYLQSRWEKLKDDARPGTKLKKSRYRDRFFFFYVTALLRTGDYETAEKACTARIESDHDFNNLARTLLILASIHKATTGMSRQYIGDLRELAQGYGSTDAYPAALYLLGDFYEQKRKYNEAYSAYTDLVAKYPGSPEAVEAAKKLAEVKKHDPRRVFYLPGRKIVNDTESLDIAPERDMPEENEASVYYAVSVGPFDAQKTASSIKKELVDFEAIKTVKLSSGYALYVGRCRNEDEALELRIRLAEEHGLNGRIVRVSAGGKQSYIYGE
jgi:TolA-binding protein